MPWLWISCKGTFELKANEAPERRNAWKVRLVFFKLSLRSRDLKWRLTCLSVSGSHLVAALYWNKGELLEPGVIFRRFLIAVTRHMGLTPREGILRMFIDFLSCVVLVHLTMIWRPVEAKIMSALAR